MIHDILILPDIHGRTFWKDAVEHEQFATIIFLGDYLDPYPSEGINDEQALATFKEIWRKTILLVSSILKPE